MFASAAFDKSENIVKFIVVMSISTIFIMKILIVNLKYISKIIINSSFWWTTIFFTVIMAYGLLTDRGWFSLQFHILIYLVVIYCLIILVMYKGDKTELLIKSSALSSIILCSYILINEYSLFYEIYIFFFPE